MKKINITRQLSIIAMFCNSLFAQINVSAVNVIPIAKNVSINNPVWSIDSKHIAFETLSENQQEKLIYLYQIGSKEIAKPIMKNIGSGNSLIPATIETSSRLPSWSTTDQSTIYFLYNEYKDRFMGKLNKIKYSQLPLEFKYSEKIFDDIKQESGISEYHIISYKETDVIFLRQQNSPEKIEYTYKNKRLKIFPNLDKELEKTEDINSFSLSEDGTRIIICKGQSKHEMFLWGEFEINNSGRISETINFFKIPIKRLKNGVIIEPSFNPVNHDMIAYLEMVEAHIYYLHFQSLSSDSNQATLLTENLYRNVQNQISRPNSTNYVWHPNGDYIFYITTDAKRNVAYIDLKNLKHPKVKNLETGIEFAEQISISPNGKYLAVMTQIADGDNTDALGQLFIIELTY
ncbi:MAG: hypothetical protein H8E71_06810 [Candidatus Marinimicrobia bacterium]|nr:hypothetical protein [Candidatus Neomarinimicrobiota bacterium]MBL7109337.1 hypothetical protein [Candidatus Neomarinimicrobiota bacterium]